MSIDISSGVGYGFLVELDDDMKQAVAEAVNSSDWQDFWLNIELLAKKYPTLSIENVYDENLGAAHIQGFSREYQVSSGDKYESIPPTKLVEPVELSDAESDAMEQLLDDLNLTHEVLGWYFYKTVY